MTPLKRFIAFVKERERIRQRKEVGEPKPWTKDPILQQYKFCNVHREDDTVTRWLASRWRTPHAQDPHIWFAMTLARVINWPETLDEFGYPWNGWTKQYEKKFLAVCERRKSEGLKVWGGAYMMRSVPGSKAEYFARSTLAPMWAKRKKLVPTTKDTLQTFHERLMECYGMGSFLAAQVVADTKYVHPLYAARDWWTFAAPGPGSQRGLNRVIGTPVNAPWNVEVWRGALSTVRDKLNVTMCLHAQDVQNCLCEFDKYERTRLGEGRPRTLYPGRK